MDERGHPSLTVEADYRGWLLEEDALDYETEFQSLQGTTFLPRAIISLALKPQLGC